jgi:hypothetical protein
MRFTILTARLPRMPLPTLEDIGAAMMVVPSPSGHTFESYMPRFDDEKPEADTRH